MGLGGEFDRLGHPSSYSSSGPFSIDSNLGYQHYAESSQRQGTGLGSPQAVRWKMVCGFRSPKPILLLLPGIPEG